MFYISLRKRYKLIKKLFQYVSDLREVGKIKPVPAPVSMVQITFEHL